MASKITSIYADIASISISAGGKTPTVRSLDSLRNWEASAGLPVRLLLPVTSRRDTGGRNFQYLNLEGTLASIDWYIRDLLLWAPTTHGRGIQDYAADFVEYAGKYADVMVTKRKLNEVNRYWLPGTITATPGAYEWPELSGTWYWGVDVVIAVREMLVG